MEEQADLSQEWIERERPPTIRFQGSSSLSGSVNVLSDKPANWSNIHEVAGRDIFTKPQTGLERMFMQPPSDVDEGLSMVEEAAAEEEAEEEEQATSGEETRPGTVRSADGIYANFSFPFRPESQARARVEDESSAAITTVAAATMPRSPEQFTSPLTAMTPRQPVSLGMQSPTKSPLKLFHNEYDTFTNDKLSDMIHILGSRTPALQKVAEQSEPIPEEVSPEVDSHQPSKNGTGKSHQSGVSAQTEVTDHDMGPERKRPKHEPKGSITTQNFYSNANDVMARLRMKGGGLGKGLPRVTEDRTSTAGSLHAGTTPHPRKASGGLLHKEDEHRRVSGLVPQPSGFEAMNIPVDKFAAPGFGASTKSHFSDWTSATDSRSVSAATTTKQHELEKKMRMYDSVKQTWISTPARMAPSPAVQPEQEEVQTKQPKYQNIPPNPNMTLRNGDMVYSASRLEWRHISEETERGTFVQDASHVKGAQGYPDELDLSNTESSRSNANEAQEESMQSLPQRRMPIPVPAQSPAQSAYAQEMTKVTQHGRYQEDSDVSADASLSMDSIEVTMSQSTADLVEAISKRYPIDIWEAVVNADLSDLHLRSLTGLYKCFPNLIKLNVANNQLSHLTDLPESLQELNASRNQLDALTSFSHLPNLQRLVLNDNLLPDLEGLGKLPHLCHLEVDRNHLQSLTGESLSSLVTLSAKNNQLSWFEVLPGELPALETLDLSHNELDIISGLCELSNLLSLNLDHNKLQFFQLGDNDGRIMPDLKMVRVCDNDLHTFDMQQIPNARLVYLDNNAITNLPMPNTMKHLQSFSLRRQRDSNIMANLDWVALREVERLYLSGNILEDFDFPTAFLSLKYLELAGCHLTGLPANLSAAAPNLRVLNACGNQLVDLSCLAELSRLERLFLHGNKLANLAELSRVLGTLDALKVLDVRGNPATKGFYAGSTAISSSQQGDSVDYFANFDVYASGEGERQAWQTLDEQFKATLSPKTLKRREAYQQLVWTLCRSLRWHDGRPLSKDQLVLADQHLEKSATA
ncbi:hypothetical protein BCR37DRAFT_377351 [Protomyces lactucae-debilis]|uniref:Uncharacterized protein n=1 Tax=Protomyces lactucae-debilis TaxID=2754530 RepID=A0A1Y2FNW2_PROLT|nr:uncharacterized protein BCR37DRAFT_377351 [Protomyces lactucae-debilis]ORY85653.1 hypothetical protein BCR37DRAFT_377351 [Protomyces lactucae-debilis]